MKHLISYLILILLISFSLPLKTVILKGDSNCALGEYIVETASNPFILDGVELETYIISYENTEKTIQVAVKKESEQCRYIVLSDFLSVQYICTKDYFGVKKHDDKELETDNNMLDSSGYFHQIVITRNKKNTRDCLGLIACYYPKLVKDYENAFACK